MPSSSRLGRWVEEQMRRGSAKTTEIIARRMGDHFGMYVGCGFPKSGTVWLCRLMSSYLGMPFPQNYAMPVAMRAVVHAHWDHHPELPPTVYVYRDGRDVMVSLFNHHMRQITTQRHPRGAAKTLDRYRRLFGPSFDPARAMAEPRPYLATFVEAEFDEPAQGKRSWSAHVRDWLGEPHENVTPVSYEALKLNTVAAFSDLMKGVTGEPPDARLVELAVARHDFALSSGRRPGDMDPTNPLRKGIVGDWRNHFTRDAAAAFHEHAGHELVTLGYEPDGSWVDLVES